jgi:RNA polymerase sigma-70 factor (ECF subfamily)
MCPQREASGDAYIFFQDRRTFWPILTNTIVENMVADDQKAWEQFADGNTAAFDDLFHKYSGPLRNFARHYLGRRDAADDIVQETFLQLWKRPNGFDSSRGTLKQYLFGIARKRAAQWKRDAPESPTEPWPEKPTSDMSESASIRRALLQLDHDQRGLLWLREVEGYSYAELAEILEIPEGTVKSRLFAAREALRRIWLGGQGA